MAEIQYAGETVEIDDNGFLVDLEAWNENVARALAKREGIEELTDSQMEIVKFMRGFYKKFNAFPILQGLCKDLHRPKYCVREDFINPMKAWKIAGLPKPELIGFVSVDEQRNFYQMIEPS